LTRKQFYDHVPPLDIPTPLLGHGTTSVFATTGVRVPGFVISPLVEPGAVFSRPLDHTSMLQFLGDKFGSGFYSGSVSNRQPALSPMSAIITRTVPRAELVQQPPFSITKPTVVATATRAPGANANATAFSLAAKKIVADHPGIAVGWPRLAAGVGK
jgi:phospholipase C